MARIFVVDDEEGICQILKTILEDEGYSVQTADRLYKARSLLDEETPDLLLLDIKMPDGDGLDFLESLQDGLRPPVIVISGHGQIEDAVRAIKLGAYDFLEKPIALERLLGTVKKALRVRRRQHLESEAPGILDGLVGETKAVKNLKSKVLLVAKADVTVLICGESGTGKGLLAREIHRLSDRVEGPFVELNCAAIPDDLLEAELFGYERGAFSGAYQQKKGKFEMAHGGILFLDEVADLSLAAQAKVLKVIEEKTLSRLGGNDLLTVDVRVVTATNRELGGQVNRGKFREDLYFRLNVVPLWIPPLRERKGDVELLFWHFLERAIGEMGKPVRQVDPDIFAVLREYSWPGNVRELKNITERLLIFSQDGRIGTELMKQVCLDLFERPKPLHSLEDRSDGERVAEKLEQAKKRFESRLILDRLELFEGNITKAARSLGISREYLSRRLKTLA
jgi:two-component system nitrogen regulation response regulator NtrX